MSQNPYENEPGFEDAKTDYDKKNQEAYVAKVSASGGLLMTLVLNIFRSGMKL